MLAQIDPLKDGISSVTLLAVSGSDLDIVNAARVSLNKHSAVLNEKDEKLIRYLLQHRHTSPFEHNQLRYRVKLPIFVVREWHRHRIGWCLTGDTEIWTESIGPRGDRTVRKRPIQELWRNWHYGVPDTLGRIRKLKSCMHLPLRVLNEDTQVFEINRMDAIWQSGIKEVYRLKLNDGKTLVCSKDHRILTADGWAKVSELSGTEPIAVVGRRALNAGRQIPPSLRSGIGVWTTMQRTHLLKPIDTCYLCENTFPREELVLDHVIPVVADLQRALDITNLKPACERCHRLKTDSEQKLAKRPFIAAGSAFVRLRRRPYVCGEKMTYDIGMQGPHHNFVANGIVVHNSYNEVSGRYIEFDKDFPFDYYIPPIWRKQAVSNRQASEGDFDDVHATAKYSNSMREAIDTYRFLISRGVAREQARCVLPLATYTEMYATCNLVSLFHFCGLRLHKDAQWEIRMYAKALLELAQPHFPVAIAAWKELNADRLEMK